MGDKQVYPQAYETPDANGHPKPGPTGGMTLREHYAGLAMAALIGSAPPTGAGAEAPFILARASIMMADALIKELDK